MQLAALLLLCIIAQSDAKPRGLGPAGRVIFKGKTVWTGTGQARVIILISLIIFA